jgi:hypothetical protein
MSSLCFNVIDYFASERRYTLGSRFDWLEGMYCKLSIEGVEIVACMSSDDGRSLIKMIQTQMSIEERKAILQSYSWNTENAMTDINSVVAYLEEIANAIVDQRENRLLMISY